MVPTNMDALEWLRKHLEEDGSDVLREMVKTFAEVLMSAEADALCGAGYGERSPGRVTKRNGYRPATSTPGLGRSSWRSPSCGGAATSRNGCSSRGAAPSRH